MRETVPNTSAFPTARCEPCGKSVLTYVTLDERGDEVRCCVHCDGAIVEPLRWLTASELEAEGYENRLPTGRQTEIRRRMRLRRMRILRDAQDKALDTSTQLKRRPSESAFLFLMAATGERAPR